mmetsp:Transcript_397/g.1102  ORF Transcript_397/g.1102 Transcript_397/m.1102 type:complete len:274 (-) Transcript_397:2262-3083(-)
MSRGRSENTEATPFQAQLRTAPKVQSLANQLPNALPSFRCFKAMRHLHELQQSSAGAVVRRDASLDAHQHSSCYLPLPLGVVLVAHVEELEEFYCIALPHLRDDFICDENLGKILLENILLLLLDLLSHLEALPRVPGNLRPRRAVNLHAHVIQVYAVELHRRRRASNNDFVDESALGPDGVLTQVNHRLGYHDGHAVGFRGSFDGRGNAHVRRKIRAVDLEFTAHSAFNGPSFVKANADVDAAVRTQSELESGMFSVARNHRRVVHSADDTS